MPLSWLRVIQTGFTWSTTFPKAKIQFTLVSFPDLHFKIELLRAEYAIDVDELDHSVEAYKRAYKLAKDFHASYADYVTRRIDKKVQNLPKEKMNYILIAVFEAKTDRANDQ